MRWSTFSTCPACKTASAGTMQEAACFYRPTLLCMMGKALQPLDWVCAGSQADKPLTPVMSAQRALQRQLNTSLEVRKLDACFGVLLASLGVCPAEHILLTPASDVLINVLHIIAMHGSQPLLKRTT